jgi:uncharacterized repeat protein (TIGR03803 family)
MRTSLVALLTGAICLAGCSNAHSTVPQPIGYGRPEQRHSSVFRSDPHVSFKLLHTFTGHYIFGQFPEGALVRDAAGDLFGATAWGGADDKGVVFELDSSGDETIVHAFDRTSGNGQFPSGLTIDPAGNIYGTTLLGGGSPKCRQGCGVVFKIDPSHVITILHRFNRENGEKPIGDLVRDDAGNLYGVTGDGGSSRVGVVFKVDSSGNETVLHNFGRSGGAHPEAGMIRDTAGNFYGTTSSGGASGAGVVFRIDPAGKETVLHSFNVTDGQGPAARLLRDAAGNLFGTAVNGGAANDGVIFELDPNGNETVLHSFAGAVDGSNPIGDLVQDTAGNMYGTTYHGGSVHCEGVGCGTVFKMDSAGNLTVLHRFDTYFPPLPFRDDGTNPKGDLVIDAAGNLFGTTSSGGLSWGVVFEMIRSSR